jgi:DNA-directed RNA polymerase subunit F
VPKQTSKGSKHGRRESALERKAMQHQDFIGQADTERAQAEFQKHERLDAERNQEVVKEMADELAGLAGVKKDDAELAFRIPRSIDEGKRMVREAPEVLREKARERIEQLPEPARRAVDAAENMIGLMLVPARFAWGIARDVLKFPLAMLRTLRQREV